MDGVLASVGRTGIFLPGRQVLSLVRTIRVVSSPLNYFLLDQPHHLSTRTEDSGVRASCPVSNDSAIVDRGSIIISSSSACTGTRDKPTTGLLRSLMIGPTQDRRSTMELYRQTLSSSSPVSSSSSTLQSSRRKVREGDRHGGKFCFITSDSPGKNVYNTSDENHQLSWSTIALLRTTPTSTRT